MTETERIAYWRDAYERGRADEQETRCPSCEHTWQFHQPDGCWFTVATGRQGAVLNCACAVTPDLIESETT